MCEAQRGVQIFCFFFPKKEDRRGVLFWFFSERTYFRRSIKSFKKVSDFKSLTNSLYHKIFKVVVIKLITIKIQRNKH